MANIAPEGKQIVLMTYFVGACFVCLALLAVARTPARPRAQTNPKVSIPPEGDEFVGPFASWTNVKTAYGVAGDRVRDDTVAIQRGLDELGKPGHSRVLFLPSGTYRITKTVVLRIIIDR